MQVVVQKKYNYLYSFEGSAVMYFSCLTFFENLILAQPLYLHFVWPLYTLDACLVCFN